jgi:hypothetical protein
MSNAALYIKWGQPVRGRESKSIEVFMHALEYYASLEKQKKIAAQRVYVAETGDFGQFGGFILLEGDVAQLRAVLDSEDYKNLLMQAHQIVEHLETIHLAAGDEVQKVVARVANARRQMGITT